MTVSSIAKNNTHETTRKWKPANWCGLICFSCLGWIAMSNAISSSATLNITNDNIVKILSTHFTQIWSWTWCLTWGKHNVNWLFQSYIWTSIHSKGYIMPSWHFWKIIMHNSRYRISENNNYMCYTRKVYSCWKYRNNQNNNPRGPSGSAAWANVSILWDKMSKCVNSQVWLAYCAPLGAWLL